MSDKAGVKTLLERMSNHIAMMAPHQKERLTGQLLIEARDALRVVQDGFPVIDRLQERLEAGCVIKWRGHRWCLVNPDDSLIVSGLTVREMLTNLIFAE